jgi:hypothetical protein
LRCRSGICGRTRERFAIDFQEFIFGKNASGARGAVWSNAHHDEVVASRGALDSEKGSSRQFLATGIGDTYKPDNDGKSYPHFASLGINLHPEN